MLVKQDLANFLPATLPSQGEGFKNVDSRPSDKAYLKGNENIVYVHKV